MKSFAIAAVLALAGFAFAAAPASADHFNGYRRSPAACGSYHGGFGQWSHGPVRPRLNLYPSSGWHRGHGHNHDHDHGYGRRNNNSGFYFGNRDFSLGIRF
jgi:hypothetical protein